VTVESESSFLSFFLFFEGFKRKLEGCLSENPVKKICSWQKSKMAAIGHRKNSFFNGLTKIAVQYIISVVLEVAKFKFYINFTI